MTTKTLKEDATFDQYLEWIKNTYEGNSDINSVHIHIESEPNINISFIAPKGLHQDQRLRRGLLQEITPDGVKYMNGSAYFENACLMLEQRVKSDPTYQRIDANYNDGDELGVKIKLSYVILASLPESPNERKGSITLERTLS